MRHAALLVVAGVLAGPLACGQQVNPAFDCWNTEGHCGIPLDGGPQARLQDAPTPLDDGSEPPDDAGDVGPPEDAPFGDAGRADGGADAGGGLDALPQGEVGPDALVGDAAGDVGEAGDADLYADVPPGASLCGEQGPELPNGDHPPVACFHAWPGLTVRVGETIVLDAAPYFDVDGDGVEGWGWLLNGWSMEEDPPESWHRRFVFRPQVLGDHPLGLRVGAFAPGEQVAAPSSVLFFAFTVTE